MAPRLPVLRAVLAAMLLASLGSAPATVAQDAGLDPRCALTTPDEANSVFAGAGLTFNDNSSAYYCTFGGTFDLVVSLQAETSLAEHKAQFPDGGTDVTVAGLPAWWREGGGSLGVAANGSILHMNGWGSSDDSATQLALLSALAERIVPRIPPPADPATVARLRATLPAGAEGTVVPGWSVVGNAAGIPGGQVLADLLAAQGRTPEELVLVIASVGDTGTGVVATVPGMDGAALVPALLGALVPGILDAPTSTVELGGRQVTRFGVEPPFHGAAAGEVVGIATGPDPFLADFFAALESSGSAGPAETPVAGVASPSPVASTPPSPVASAAPAALPNVRVTDARATFVPSVPDADGVGCSGPYMDVRFTIANVGPGTFPIAQELALTKERVPEPAGGYLLLILQVWIDQFGTGQDMAQQNVEVRMADVPGGALEPGRSVDVTWRYRVPDDQTSIRVFGEVSWPYFFRTTGSAGERYEAQVPIPIWDLGMPTAQTVAAKQEDGTPQAISKVVIQNLGGSTTPGPVSLSVAIAYTDNGFVGGWTDVTKEPIGASGTAEILGATTLSGDRPLQRDRARLRGQVVALCPDGTPGQLSDGNRADDSRVLRQRGQAPTSP